jgi:hypothetical protein
MSKLYKKKNSLKNKNFKKTKTIKQRGGAGRASMKRMSLINKQLANLPAVPQNDPIYYPNTPVADPMLKKMNDECYDAKQNIKTLTLLLEKEKRDIIEGRKNEALLCQYFNKYITALKKQPFYNAIYLETFGPDVPV